MVGERYKYSHVNPNVPSRDLKDALLLLEEAQCGQADFDDFNP